LLRLNRSKSPERGSNRIEALEKQMKAAGKIDPKSREVETRRIGLQDRLAEKVVDAKEDSDCHRKARNDRFDITGEPSETPSA
jgi:hypothetical protein